MFRILTIGEQLVVRQASTYQPERESGTGACERDTTTGFPIAPDGPASPPAEARSARRKTGIRRRRRDLDPSGPGIVH